MEVSRLEGEEHEHGHQVEGQSHVGHLELAQEIAEGSSEENTDARLSSEISREMLIIT